MRLRRIAITDFISHAHTILDFTDDVTTFYGMNFDHALGKWSNGAGKSTILYAICWALWGDVPPKTKHKNAVIRRGADRCQVELHLAGSDGSLQVVRSKPRVGAEQLQAYYNSTRVPGEREETQSKLEALYGISWETFCNTIFIGPQSDVAKFASATPTERARILEELINLAPFKEALGRLQVTQQAVDTRTSELKGSLAVIERHLTHIQGELQEVSAKFRGEQASVQAKEAQVRVQISTLERESLDIQKQLQNPPQGTLAELQAKYNTHREHLSQLRVEQEVAEAKLRMHVPTIGQVCPQCAQPFSQVAAENLGRVRHALQNEAQVRRRDVSQAQAVMTSLEGEIAAHRDWASVERRLRSRIDEIKLTAYQIQSSVESRSLELLQAELLKQRKLLQEHRELQTNYRDELSKLLQRSPVLSQVQKGLKHDVRNMLLDDIRAQLTVHTHRYLEVLAESDFRVLYPFQSGTGKETFEIELWAGDAINPLPSVGENYRAVLAILLALRSVLRCQSTTPLDFLLIDDPLFGVDEAGGDAFVKLVHMLALETPQLCITLPREMPLPGRSITVQRTGRVSSVMEQR